jgi:adenylate cyclase
MRRGPAATAPDGPARPLRTSICVLPFANMGGDPAEEYLSDGITEDIITDLSKVSALRVIARNSAFVHKGRHVDILRVAREFNVGHVLEGSVRKAGGRVRINAQLVDAATNDHLWAERYDRDLHDIFSLQDEITHAIVAALKLRLLPDERKAIEQRGTTDAAAYNCFLTARQFYVSGTEGDAHRADEIIRLAGRATEIDPGYARAWALLALGKVLRRYVVGGAADTGLQEADRALALDPRLAEAHAIKARVYSDDGHYEAASVEIDQALRLDPDSYEVNRSAAYLRFRQQRVHDAIPYFEKAMTLVDDDVNSANMLVSCYQAAGNAEGLRRVAAYILSHSESLLAANPNDVSALAYGAAALAIVGDTARCRDWTARAILLDPDNIKMRYNLACNQAALLKDTDSALDMLEWVFARIATGMLNHARSDPDLDSLRDQPRFKTMLAAAEARLAAT